MNPSEVGMGGGRRISVFLKGNGDLADSLLAMGEGGQKIETGLRQLLHSSYGGQLEVEIFHEPSGPLGTLLRPAVPQPDLPGRFGGGSQFALAPVTKLFERTCDVVVFSLEADIARPVWRHRKTGVHVSPPAERDRERGGQGLSEEYELQGLVAVEDFQRDFTRLVQDIKKRLAAHVIVFNCSTFDPHDRGRNYFGVPDTPALRALKFNHALIEISAQEGISIVDVDRLIAEMGGESNVTRAFEYSPRAHELIRDEFVRILHDIALFQNRPYLKLVTPLLDDQMTGGVVRKWHKKEGDQVDYGDDLVDVECELVLSAAYRAFADQAAGEGPGGERGRRKMTVTARVVSSDAGVLRRIRLAEGSYGTVGSVLAVLSTVDDGRPAPADKELAGISQFRVVTNVIHGV
jgi:hypothetical protein